LVTRIINADNHKKIGLLDNALNGIYRTTRDGKFLMANKTYYRRL
jgi:PAS domain-containing protein